MTSDILFSYVIPTIGRASLEQAINSVLTQNFPEGKFEVIVVNDSGTALPEAGWQSSPHLKMINTNRCERSVARNTGAAVAKGRFLAFLDDDDWILPDSLTRFWALIQQRTAGMYYGGYRFVDSHGITLNEYYPDEEGNCFIRFMSGEWQPLQASVFEAETFRLVGGFLSLKTLRGGDEDVDLTRRISLEHNIAGINELVAVIRIDRGASTTNYSNLQEQSRQSRDLILNAPGAFTRLLRSAQERKDHSAYWHGRLTWIYLSAVAWNVREKKILTALSRLTYFGLSMIFSFKYWLSPKFWQGATSPHKTDGWLSTR